MVWKLVTAAFVLGIVPAALFAAGGFPQPAREDVVPYTTRTISAEEQWRDRVGAICGWERRQGRAFDKAFRRASTPADVELMFKAAIRLSDESLAIFSRLETPFEYRRDARTLRRLIWEERMGIKNALDAFHDRRRAAFLRSVRRFAEADLKSSRLLAQLGVDGCNVKPVAVPDSARVRIV